MHAISGHPHESPCHASPGNHRSIQWLQLIPAPCSRCNACSETGPEAADNGRLGSRSWPAELFSRSEITWFLLHWSFNERETYVCRQNKLSASIRCTYTATRAYSLKGTLLCHSWCASASNFVLKLMIIKGSRNLQVSRSFTGVRAVKASTFIVGFVPASRDFRDGQRRRIWRPLPDCAVPG